MIRDLCTAITLSALVLLSGFSSAQATKKPPIPNLRANAEFHLYVCQLAAELGIQKAKAGEPEQPDQTIRECITNARKQMRPLYQAAAQSIARKPAATQLLKDYYAAWLSAMDGLVPDENEGIRAYETRQGQSKRRADDAWNKLEVEVGP